MMQVQGTLLRMANDNAGNSSDYVLVECLAEMWRYRMLKYGKVQARVGKKMDTHAPQHTINVTLIRRALYHNFSIILVHPYSNNSAPADSAQVPQA